MNPEAMNVEQKSRAPLIHLLPQVVASTILVVLIFQYAQPHNLAFWIGLALTLVSAAFFCLPDFSWAVRYPLRRKPGSWSFAVSILASATPCMFSAPSCLWVR
jgi:hypothetical protein